jgi:ankyrin repeat protein
MFNYYFSLVIIITCCTNTYSMDLFGPTRFGILKEVKEILSNKTTNVNQRNYHNETALMVACAEGDVNIVRVLLSHPEINVDAKAKDGQTALHYAAQRNAFTHAPNGTRAAIIALLCAKNKNSLNARDKYGATPFFNAVANGVEEAVAALLAQPDIDVTTPNCNGDTPLQVAEQDNKLCHDKGKIISMIQEHLKKNAQ